MINSIDETVKLEQEIAELMNETWAIVAKAKAANDADVMKVEAVRFLDNTSN